MGPTQKKTGPSRPLNMVKYYPHGYLKIINYLLSQELTSWCKFFKLVLNYFSLCLLSDFLTPDYPGSKGWGPGARTPSNPPQAVRRHKIPGWDSRLKRSSS